MKLPGGTRTKRGVPARATYAELGVVLDVVVAAGEDDAKITERTPPTMLWTPQSRALVWWTGWRPTLEDGEPQTAGEKQAARTFHRWGVWEQQGIGREKRDGADRWLWHQAVRIGYRSNKFGPLQDYDHDFTSQVRLYQPVDAPGPWVLRGGRLRVTKRGIEG